MSENDPIREFQSRLDKVKDKAEGLRPVLKSCQEAIQRSGMKKITLAVGHSTQNPKVEILVMIDSLNDLVPLFRELAKEGIRRNKVDDHQDQKLLDIIPMRNYKLGDHCLLIATLFGEFRERKEGDGPVCRMQQVGVKEVPVYDIVCD